MNDTPENLIENLIENYGMLCFREFKSRGI